jgi:hypothetical protein
MNKGKTNVENRGMRNTGSGHKWVFGTQEPVPYKSVGMEPKYPNCVID